MTTRSKVREGIATMTFMFLVTVVSISAVSGLHLSTRERVAVNASLFLKEAIMQCVNVPVPDAAADVLAWYEAHVRAVPSESRPEYFEISSDDGENGKKYAFLSSGRGLWGGIQAVIGLRDNFKTVEGAAFLNHNETPGLGARISESWFTEQLAGKSAPIKLVPEKTRSEDPHEIDGITGATITSAAVRDMLNRTLAAAAGQVSEDE